MKHAVTALTAALFGSGIAIASDQDRVETSLLVYSERDRVSAAEGIVGITKLLRGDYLLSLKLTYDGLTGASPNGATPSQRLQTFTRPSGNGSFVTQPGTTPLDDTFKDTRFAVDVSLSKPLGRMTQLLAGFHLSAEHDYSSLGMSSGIMQDLWRKNTTLGLSVAYSRDAVKAEGGAPIPFSVMLPPRDDSGGEADEDESEGGPSEAKDVFDAVVSLTQVIDRNTVARFNYSLNHSSGYLNDPYKLLSVVQNEASANPGEPDSYIYERRPGSRNKHAVFGEIRRYLGGNTLDLSYRYFWDDWGVNSHTADLFFWWQFKNGHALQPHARWYSQSKSDFHRYFLVKDAPLPTNASADYRLARLEALTVGLQYSLPFGSHTRLSVTGEYYAQVGDKSPPEAFGELKQFDLFPDLNAFMLRLGIARDF